MITRPRVRQLSLSELLDETFRLYRANFLTFVAIAALVLVPYSLLSFAIQLPFQGQLAQLQQQAANPNNPFNNQSPVDYFSSILFWYLGLLGLGMLYAIIFQPLLEGALAWAISQRYLGRLAGVGESFGAALRRSPALIGARLIPALLGLLMFGGLIGLFTLILVLVMGTATLDDSSSSSAVLVVALSIGGFGLIMILTILALALYVRIFFTAQAAVIEQRGPWQSVVRSWQLTRQMFWRTTGYLIVIILLIYVLGAVASLTITIPVSLFISDYRLETVINTCVSTVFGVLITPFGMIAYTLMYYDLRIRKEGFDLEQQVSTLTFAQSLQP